VFLVENATALEACVEQPDDDSFIDAFQGLLESIRGFIKYENCLASDTPPTHELGNSVAKNLNSSGLSVAPSYDPLIEAFRGLSTAGIAYLRHVPCFYRDSVDREFREMAKACMSHLNGDRECSFEPYAPYHQQYIPETLRVVYDYMGYGSIDDAVFLHIAGWYDMLYLEQYSVVDHWSWSCDNSRNLVNWTSIDILLSRDVLTAVTYMHRSTNGLVSIEQLAFRDLKKTAEHYLGFTNDFDN
jgi:predicted HicB family RNase H-like nuclease